MKKNLPLILFAAMLFVSAFAKAQTSGGPDAYGYIWRNNLDLSGPVYNWIDISSRPGVVDVTGLGDDTKVGPFALTFPFHYYWYDPSTFYISSNGALLFNNQNIAYPFPFIPATAAPNNWLAVMASDLTFTDASANPVPGAKCMYWQGTDTLIVTWENVPFWDSAGVGYQGANTFQVILSTIDSSITFQYLLQTGDISIIETSDFLEIGIENISGAMGLEVQHDIYPTTGMAVKFYYPDTVTVAVSDAASSYTGNPGSKGIILATGINTYTSVAEVKNVGNQTLPTFNSYSRVVNASNLVQVRDTVTVTNLAPSATQLITYPDVFNPSVAGRYRQINTTIMTGDANTANNVDTLELWVVNPTLASVSLQWDNGTASGSGLSWTGGGGGVAQHFTPPYYPAIMTAVGVLVTDDPDAVGFHMFVFADDGVNGGPGTMLDSFYVSAGAFTPGTYYQTNLVAPLTINTGGFYVAWQMGGPNIVIGEDAGTPHSRQSYEILGPAGNPGTWAEYRNGDLEDPIIHAIIQGTVGLPDVALESASLQVYPNPARFKTTLQYNLTKAAEMKMTIYTIEGALVSERNLGKRSQGEGTIELNVQNLNPGIYICNLTVGNNEYHKRINVVR
jgi:hypothetical protein